MTNTDEIVGAKRSACCGATVHVENGMPDFPVLSDPRKARAVTCWFACDGCGRACDLVDPASPRST